MGATYRAISVVESTLCYEYKNSKSFYKVFEKHQYYTYCGSLRL